MVHQYQVPDCGYIIRYYIYKSRSNQLVSHTGNVPPAILFMYKVIGSAVITGIISVQIIKRFNIKQSMEIQLA